MNKLYFRAWITSKKKMFEVESFMIDRNRYQTVVYVDEKGERETEYFDNVNLLQGFEIGDEIIYVGDIIEVFNKDENIAKIGVFSLEDLIDIKDKYTDYTYKVVGNIYENEEFTRVRIGARSKEKALGGN